MKRGPYRMSGKPRKRRKVDYFFAPSEAVARRKWKRDVDRSLDKRFDKGAL